MKTSPLDYLLSSIALSLYVLLALLVAWPTAVMVTIPWLGDYHVIADLALFLLAFGVAAIVGCRLIVRWGLVAEGDFSMDERAFAWWKLFTVSYEFGRGALKPFTLLFFRPVVAALFGAGVGRDIALGGHLVDPQFITIGDEAIVGQDSVVTAHVITSGRIRLAPVRIGDRATVGVNSVIMAGVTLGEDAIVAAGSVVPPDTAIPAGELWGGIPARRIRPASTDA
jgi:serine acetyltransferase